MKYEFLLVIRFVHICEKAAEVENYYCMNTMVVKNVENKTWVKNTMNTIIVYFLQKYSIFQRKNIIKVNLLIWWLLTKKKSVFTTSCIKYITDGNLYNLFFFYITFLANYLRILFEIVFWTPSTLTSFPEKDCDDCVILNTMKKADALYNVCDIGFLTLLCVLVLFYTESSCKLLPGIKAIKHPQVLTFVSLYNVCIILITI